MILINKDIARLNNIIIKDKYYIMKSSKKLLVLLTLGHVLYAADENDRMTQLPYCEPFPYPAYSGYLPVSDSKQLHYVYVTS
jgi:hypothetical protein